MRRAVVWAVVVLTALVLQSTVFAQIELAGAKPELVYLATIALALLEGPGSGALAGFVGGMAQDFLLNLPKGITALTLTLLGYVVGQLRAYVLSPSPWLPVVVVGAGTFAGVVFHGVISFLLNQLPVDWLTLLRVAFLSAAYNAILTPFLFPVIRRLAQVSARDKVYRT
jgi:rod shape-determining protein MreD